jgi:dynein heavy chain 2
VSIYDCLLSPILAKDVNLKDAKWASNPGEREKLSNALIEIYQKTREKFTVDDHRHYLFTPRDVTTLVKNICRYELNMEELLEVVIHESTRIFRDRLVNSEACNKFDVIVAAALRQHFRYSQPSSQPISYFSSLTTPRGVVGVVEDAVDRDLGVGRVPREEAAQGHQDEEEALGRRRRRERGAAG